jgi:tripartite-type tricarboxylate transporter receptor subunit TctC
VTTRRGFVTASALSGAMTFATWARAQSWMPGQPIRVIVPYAAGGASDLLVRLLIDRARERLGQPFVLDNRAGASTQIGTSAVVRAKPDGETLLLVANTLAVNPSLFAKLPYDTLRDLEPVTYAAVTPHTLVVNNDLPVHDLQQLIAYARARPGQLSYGSVGAGTSFHLGMEELKKRSGVFLLHVPYRGTGQVLTDVMANNIQLTFANTPSVVQLVKTGRMRAIAMAHRSRDASLPDVPTVAEQGFPGFESNSTFMFFAPAGTPVAILDRLNAEIVGMLREPSVRDALAQQSIEVIAATRAQTSAFVRAEMAKYAELVKFSGAKAD